MSSRARIGDDPWSEPLRLNHWVCGYLKGPVLTMTGADLLDSIREQGVWNKMKSIAKEKGVGLAFDSIGGLAKLAIGQMLAPTA